MILPHENLFSKVSGGNGQKKCVMYLVALLAEYKVEQELIGNERFSDGI